MRKGESAKQVNVEDEDGRILTEENEVCERRKQYFKEGGEGDEKGRKCEAGKREG